MPSHLTIFAKPDNLSLFCQSFTFYVHTLSSVVQLLCHSCSERIQFIEIRKNRNNHTKHDRNPDKTDLNIKKCFFCLNCIGYIATILQKHTNNKTGQSHAAFYKESLECSDQACNTEEHQVSLAEFFSSAGRARSIGSPERIPTSDSHSVLPRLYCIYLFLVCAVSLNSNYLSACFLCKFLCSFLRFFEVKVNNRYICAGLCKSSCCAFSDSSRCTCYKNLFLPSSLIFSMIPIMILLFFFYFYCLLFL